MSATDQSTDQAGISLDRVVVLNWALLLAMTVGAWLCFSALSGRSVLVGGLIANLSFMLLRRDLTGLLTGGRMGVKVSFFLKYYARLTVLAVLLFVLIRGRAVNNIGLLLGLSTVLLGVVITVTGEARKILYQAKEAS